MAAPGPWQLTRLHAPTRIRNARRRAQTRAPLARRWAVLLERCATSRAIRIHRLDCAIQRQRQPPLVFGLFLVHFLLLRQDLL